MNITMNQEYKIFKLDPYMNCYHSDIDRRMNNYDDLKNRLLGIEKSLNKFANGYLYFGFHCVEGGWVYREWAPNAKGITLFGDFNDWNRDSDRLNEIGGGVWEIYISREIPHGSKVRIRIETEQEVFERIPTYCRRSVQNKLSKEFDGVIWMPQKKFRWTDSKFKVTGEVPLLIYECHIGMASEECTVASFKEFTKNVLPRIKSLGYNAIQLMAIMEHPYYGSFGYQVSNFFAVSSRFGKPEDLKHLINTAHKNGIAVIMDLVHSHAAKNEVDGLGRFDGTDYQYFHAGRRGEHPVWDTKLFNYDKPEVVHFLLSNLKYWMDEYHMDGFRFDGITSMLYHDHGLSSSFDNYSKYFSYNTDEGAVAYLQLATELCKEIRSDCVLIAEDMSGMPGICLPIEDGGIGFDYRLAMGVSDFWVNHFCLKSDHEWNISKMWHELSQRRPSEKVIGYCESHDQALVGSKTIIFRLADQAMYWNMDKESNNMTIERAIKLHKVIRLITILGSGEGYLNFMGNEFGHPEWIDFPRQGNGNSYFYSRRQWSLVDNPELKYTFLQTFDREMIAMVKDEQIMMFTSHLSFIDECAKVIVFTKGNFICAFNFHHYESYWAEFSEFETDNYEYILNSEWNIFGGYKEVSYALEQGDKEWNKLLIPNRCGIILKKVNE